MGGIGSGSYYRWNKRQTTNETKRIDIRYLKREGLLKTGMTGTLSWSRGEEAVGWIRYQITGTYLRLLYRHRWPGEEWQDADETIYFDWTPCNYGGRRQWLLCPHCQRRTAIIYGQDSGFLCRKCYRLPYACQSESRIDRLIRKKHKIGRKMKQDDGYGKPKGMHWATYNRLRQQYWQFDDQIDWYINSIYRFN